MDRIPRRALKFIKYPPQFLYAIGLGPLIGRLILLLTTTGRVSGKPRTTSLQYEKIDGSYYIASAMGAKADWYRNIQANHHVEVRVGQRHVRALALPIENPARVADFIEYRCLRRPRMVGAILRREGIRPPITREKIEQYAAGITMVILTPQEDA